MSATHSLLRNNNANDLEMVHVPANNKPKHTESATTPLLSNTSAPLAKLELDDDLDHREGGTTPYPGIDDGLFNGTDKNNHNGPHVENVDPKHSNIPHPDVEIFSNKRKDPEPLEPPDDTTIITNRIDPDGDASPDDTDGKHDEPNHPLNPQHPKPHFPYAPGFGYDFETGGLPGEFPESIPDVNVYQHKKTLAQGMMDLALFSANANQLRYVLESSRKHPYFYPSIILLSISLFLQVAVGTGLIWNATYNVKDQKEICKANKINNFTIIGIFLVTVVNVFISAFGVANPA